MKLKSLLIFALGLLSFASCEDNMSEIGSSVRPETDNLLVQTDTFSFASSTFDVDSIYIRTSNPLLGQITDPVAGTVRTDYAAQMRILPGFNFNVEVKDSLVYNMDNPLDSLINNQLDSAVLSITYGSYLGDSLTPMAVTIFKLKDQLSANTEDFYSDFTIDSEGLEVLGTAGYTGVDYNISDSIKNAEGYIPYVDVLLKNEFKDSFYDAVVNKPEIFKDQESFQQFLPGVLMKNTFGNGTILKVQSTSIGFFYRTYHAYNADSTRLKAQDGADSSYVVNRVKVISVTPDVIQLNSVLNAGKDPVGNDSTTYIITPGRTFTEIKLPVGKIDSTINANDPIKTFLNKTSLSVGAYSGTEFFSQTAPPYMLLVEKDKINTFFEENDLPDSKTSYISKLNNDTTSVNYGYNFGNINRMILNYAEELKAKNGEVLPTDSVTLALVPVTAVVDEQSNITRVTNYFMPGGVSLKSGGDASKFNIVYLQQVNE